MSKVNDNSVGFVQGTTVLMADGKLKPIEKIRPGDWVMSFDIDYPQSPLEPRQVIDTMSYLTRDVMEVVSGDDAILVGRGQLFLTPGMDWHYAHETAYITDAEGNTRDFSVTKVNQGNFKIHDIIVDDHHSLVANGFRVHNGGSGNAGSGGPGGSGAAAGFANAAAQANSQSTGRAHLSSVNATSSNAGIAGTASATARVSSGGGSYGFANGDEGGFHTNGTNPDTRGNDNGGRGDRDTPGTRTISNSVRRKQEPPPKPKMDEKALAYAAYSALQDTMDYICDIQITYVGRSYFTVRTAVFEYMKYADALAADALDHINRSNMGVADKSNLVNYSADITNTHDIIRRSWSDPNDTAINLESIKRACLNVKQFVDRSQAVIGKYIGQQKSDIDYSVPGLPKPGKVNLPTTVVAPEYVKTTANTWVTTAPSEAGTTTTPATTGGIGASYTKTRVVRGYMYAYTPKKGWKKIGPADQKTNWL